MKDDILDWYKRDVGLKVWRETPDAEAIEELDYVITITYDNEGFRNITNNITWSNHMFNWSDYFDDGKDLPNDPIDDEAVAIDYVAFAIRTYKFVGYCNNFANTFDPVKEWEEAIKKWKMFKDFITPGHETPSMTPRGERYGVDNDEVFTCSVLDAEGAQFDQEAISYAEIVIKPPSQQYDEWEEIIYFEEVTYHLDYEDIGDVDRFENDMQQWGKMVDDVKDLIDSASKVYSVFSDGVSIVSSYKKGDYVKCTVYIAKTVSGAFHVGVKLDTLYSVAGGKLKAMKNCRCIKGLDMALSLAESLEYGMKAAAAHESKDYFNASFYFERSAIATIDFVVSCIPVIGQIYMLINAAVYFITWVLAKLGIIDKAYSLTELVYKAAAFLSPWTPTWMAMYALSAFCDDVKEKIEAHQKADPHALCVFSSPYIEDDEKPKARASYGELRRYIST